MDPVNYYITTLTTAFKNIAPVLAFIIGGYLIFIKMPFLFLKKSMDQQKKKIDESNSVPTEKYTLENYKEFQKTMKLINGSTKTDGPKSQSNSKTDHQKNESKNKQQNFDKNNSKEERKGAPEKPLRAETQTPEEIFSIKPGEQMTQSDLKKRYFELLKQNHPDRVASMGHDFKKLAEKNTKEINKAYEKLKKKAS
jgi:hypothetical protein